MWIPRCTDALHDDALLPRPGQRAAATREEQLFRRFKADESSQAITEQRRLQSPKTTTSGRRSTNTKRRKGVGAMKYLLPSFYRRRGILIQPPLHTGAGVLAVTAQAGIRFVHNSGRAGRSICETLGSGCLPRCRRRQLARHSAHQQQGLDPRGACAASPLPQQSAAPSRDITAGSGSTLKYRMGVAVADYDNDGRDDVYITALEGDRLFHNLGSEVRRCPKAAGIRMRILAPAPPGSIRPRRQGRPVRRNYVHGLRKTCRARSMAPRIVLHAGVTGTRSRCFTIWAADLRGHHGSRRRRRPTKIAGRDRA